MAQAKIIVADDDKDILTVVSLALEGEGYEVRTARDGAEALSLAEEERPDLLVLDGLMPKISGFDLCKMLKQKIFPKEPPKVVLMTAVFKKRSQEYEARDLYSVDDFLKKPFEIPDLLEAIKKQL
jgi:CheY-like chemotaxis protein